MSEILVISLEDDADRRRELLLQLPKHRKIVKAVDTRMYLPEGVIEYGARQRLRDGVRAHDRDLTRGAVGCYLSHVNVWRTFLGESAIIFEDDARLQVSFPRLLSLIPWGDKSWDIFLLGYASQRKTNIRSFLQTHAYVIRRRGVERAMPHMFPIKQQLDWQLSTLAQNNIIRIEGVPMQVVLQDKTLASRIHI